MNKFKVGDIVKLTATGKFHLNFGSTLHFEVTDVIQITHPYGHSICQYIIKGPFHKGVDEDWIEIDKEKTRELKLNILLDE